MNKKIVILTNAELNSHVMLALGLIKTCSKKIEENFRETVFKNEHSGEPYKSEDRVLIVGFGEIDEVAKHNISFGFEGNGITKLEHGFINEISELLLQTENISQEEKQIWDSVTQKPLIIKKMKEEIQSLISTFRNSGKRHKILNLTCQMIENFIKTGEITTKKIKVEAETSNVQENN